MAKSGPKKKTPKLDGKALTKVPAPPTFLGVHGKAAWSRNCRELIAASRLYGRYLDNLGDYCELFDQKARARRVLKANGGEIAVSEKNAPYNHPSANQLAGYKTQSLKYSRAFGFTPRDDAELPSTQAGGDALETFKGEAK